MRSYDNHGHTDKRYTIRILDRTPHRMFVPLALRSSDGRNIVTSNNDVNTNGNFLKFASYALSISCV